MKKVIKFIEIPTFSETDWSTRNPFLNKGETGHVIDNNIVVKSKIGPGLWNDLEYSYDSALIAEIYDLLNPYLTPAISGVTNNASGTSNSTTREIGSALSGIVHIQYSVSNIANLLGASPINITAGGIFSNEGNFANTGGADMNLTVPLNPSVVTQYTINLKPTHTNGIGSTVTTKTKFVPRIIWGVSPLTSLTGPQINTIGQKQTLLTDVFARDYTFTAAGYCYLAIPVMLAPANLLFTDITNINVPLAFSFEDLGVVSVNNGVSTYNYQIFRSSYYITESLSKVRVATQ